MLVCVFALLLYPLLLLLPFPLSWPLLRSVHSASLSPLQSPLFPALSNAQERRIESETTALPRDFNHLLRRQRSVRSPLDSQQLTLLYYMQRVGMARKAEAGNRSRYCGAAKTPPRRRSFDSNCFTSACLLLLSLLLVPFCFFGD